MSYHHYAKGAREHVFEIFRSITPEEIQDLCEKLSVLDSESWMRWRSKNLKQIQMYLRATPSERKKKNRWQNPETTVLWKYSAYLEASNAYSLLYAIGTHYLPEGGSYRDMTSAAVEAYYLAGVHRFPAWPFECTPPEWMAAPRSFYGDERLCY